jgi:hypothetical protein
MSTKLILFKTSDNREVENPGAEIWRLAKRLQALNPALTFAAARDVVMNDEPALARGYMCNDED